MRDTGRRTTKRFQRLIRFGAEVKTAVNAAHPVVHPFIPELNPIYGTIENGAPRHPVHAGELLHLRRPPIR